jgi:hypothetical protein
MRGRAGEQVDHYNARHDQSQDFRENRERKMEIGDAAFSSDCEDFAVYADLMAAA